MKEALAHSFPRRHRLKHKKLIARLFECGQHAKRYPILAVYDTFDGALQVGFAIPKRKVRSAVKRNRIRRKLREAFRLEKAMWQSGLEGFKVMFVYLPRTELTYAQIAEAMAQLLATLKEAKQPPASPRQG